MERKKFITAISLGIPLMTTGIFNRPNELKENTKTDKASKNPMVEKAIAAMLCMQRAAWEQGTASQALIVARKKDLVILLP
ncbi:MAG: hypothetical protein HC905_13575, partial [Bacteroidales bacterium]|nr:hypothetical protein [Bacteroidales bacterium]